MSLYQRTSPPLQAGNSPDSLVGREPLAASRGKVKRPAGASGNRGFPMIAAVICATAIAAVPIFSFQGESSRLPQTVAILAVGIAVLGLLRELPSSTSRDGCLHRARGVLGAVCG